MLFGQKARTISNASVIFISVLVALIAIACFWGSPFAHADEQAADQTSEEQLAELDGKTDEKPAPATEEITVKTVDQILAEQANAAKSAKSEKKMDVVVAMGKLDDGGYADGLVDGGTYLVKFAKTDDKVLSVSGSKKKGASVSTAASDMGKDQQWKVKRDSKGYVSLLNAKSGLALAVKGKAKSGADVVQAAYGKSKRAQKWAVIADGDSWKLMSALGKGLVLSISKASTKAGANAYVSNAAKAKARRFDFIHVDRDYAQPQERIDSIDTSKWYDLVSGKYALGIDLASDNANVQLQKANGSLGQLFSLEFVKTSGSLGFYRIISAASGKALAVANGNLVKGSNIECAKKANNRAQYWVISAKKNGAISLCSAVNGWMLGSAIMKAGANIYSSESSISFAPQERTKILADGFYALKAASKKSQAIDVAKSSTKNGAACQLWGYGAAFNQKWHIVAVEGSLDTYTIESVNSGKLLTAKAAEKGSQLVQREADDSELQQWKLSILSNGSLVFSSVANPELSVGYKNGKVKNGTKIVLGVGSSAAQRFRAESVSLLEKGFYFVRSAANPKLYAEVKNSSKKSGANVDVLAKAKKGHQGNQKWSIELKSNGSVRIFNCLSEKALAIKGGKAVANANIVQENKSSSKAQQWKVEYVPGTGSFKLVSALSPSYAIELSDTQAGANVRLGEREDDDGQLFTFVATTYDPLTPEQRRMADRAQGFSSKTNYLIMVDVNGCRTGVFKGSKGKWKLVRYEACTTGTPDSETIRGTYTINYHQDSLAKYPEAIHCTHITGEYFFHSILSSTDELGHKWSHGCVRLNWPYARYIQTLPYGSTVNLY